MAVLSPEKTNMKQVTIIGTSHIAADSIAKVRQKIAEEKPDIVAVELDHARLHALLAKDKPKFSPAMLKAMGVTGFAFFAIGGFLQRRLGRLIGAVPGEEMKTAVELAKQNGAKIALIDQPMSITMKRLSKIGFREKARLVHDLFLGLIGMGKAPAGLKELDLSKTPASEFVEMAMKTTKERYPQLYKALVSDRNDYMANALTHITRNEPDSKIIAVVGAGHEKEIAKILEKISGNDDLVG